MSESLKLVPEQIKKREKPSKWRKVLGMSFLAMFLSTHKLENKLNSDKVYHKPSNQQNISGSMDSENNISKDLQISDTQQDEGLDNKKELEILKQTNEWNEYFEAVRNVIKESGVEEYITIGDTQYKKEEGYDNGSIEGELLINFNNKIKQVLHFWYSIDYEETPFWFQSESSDEVLPKKKLTSEIAKLNNITTNDTPNKLDNDLDFDDNILKSEDESEDESEDQEGENLEDIVNFVSALQSKDFDNLNLAGVDFPMSEVYFNEQIDRWLPQEIEGYWQDTLKRIFIRDLQGYDFGYDIVNYTDGIRYDIKIKIINGPISFTFMNIGKDKNGNTIFEPEFSIVDQTKTDNGTTACNSIASVLGCTYYENGIGLHRSLSEPNDYERATSINLDTWNGLVTRTQTMYDRFWSD